MGSFVESVIDDQVLISCKCECGCIRKHLVDHWLVEKSLEKPWTNGGLGFCEPCFNERYLGVGKHVREYSPVGAGWLPLVTELNERLTALYSDYRIAQVKEKFGGLRYYVDGVGDEGYKLIDEAEAKSYELCENCGDPGILRKGGWLKTYCDGCAK